jgi:hypothetical protein
VEIQQIPIYKHDQANENAKSVSDRYEKFQEEDIDFSPSKSPGQVVFDELINQEDLIQLIRDNEKILYSDE